MSIGNMYKCFPDVHPNIVLKTDVLRQGMKISKAAQNNFNQRDDILWRGWHIFSYDAGTKTVYKDKIPMGFHLSDVCPVQIRTTSDSPSVMDFSDGQFFLSA